MRTFIQEVDNLCHYGSIEKIEKLKEKAIEAGFHPKGAFVTYIKRRKKAVKTRMAGLTDDALTWEEKANLCKKGIIRRGEKSEKNL